MSRRIGFWSVFALVTGSQIGSGVFMSPATLAPYGMWGILGWVISGFGALALAFVFSELCTRFPQTGGPHVYVKEAFGRRAAFFTGWTYWIVSFVSTTAVIVTSVGYLSPLLPFEQGIFYIILEFALLGAIVLLNLRGVKAAGHAEFFLTLLKFIPLLVMPALALFYFDASNISMSPAALEMPISSVLGHVVLLTLWGFIGVESATTAAGSVINPSKTIPRAIIFGTLSVALIYMFCSIGIMGLIPGAELMSSRAPFVDAAAYLFKGNWHLLISVVASVVCLGTLNAWILTSGQIALGLAEDNLLPQFFARTNKAHAPYWGILVSSFGIAPLLILTNSDSLAQQITDLIDISVISFLFVYLACALGLLKLLRDEKKLKISVASVSACVAIIFCSFVIYQTPFTTLLVSSLFTLSGLPMYWRLRAKAPRAQI
jgi:APA family basic amino acid/polyamine antiporter